MPGVKANGAVNYTGAAAPGIGLLLAHARGDKGPSEVAEPCIATPLLERRGCAQIRLPDGGALRVLGHTPCKSTERAINWNAAGPAGPPGIAAAYVGQAHFGHAHALPVLTPALEAETPKLPAAG